MVLQIQFNFFEIIVLYYNFKISFNKNYRIGFKMISKFSKESAILTKNIFQGINETIWVKSRELKKYQQALNW
jgi:hypothetical protein